MTMPTFTDGTVTHATDLNTIATGINNLGTLVTGVAATRQVIPVSSCNLNQTQPIPNSSDTLADFFGTTINEDNIWISSVDHHIVNTNGIYVAWAQVNFDGNATGIRACHITLNGTSVATNSVAAGSDNPVTTAGVGTAFTCMTPPLSLTAGAAIYLLVFQNSGGNLNVIPNESGLSLSVIRIGA